ncbi:MAG: hypothetical protein J0H18_01010 [Rhizobiales bacterium]|nr:hypothetical protein [Hyphomicrobiales bacterium]OJY07472.1 MAG: hypothetical protein BGP07_06205 [Rhizobiales bacterium 63-22]
MGDYNFWADLLDTFQTSPDWIKALWVLMPPGFLLGLVALLLRFQAAISKTDGPRAGRLLYSVYRRADGVVRVIDHRPTAERGPVPLPVDIFGDASGETLQEPESPSRRIDRLPG